MFIIKKELRQSERDKLYKLKIFPLNELPLANAEFQEEDIKLVSKEVIKNYFESIEKHLKPTPRPLPINQIGWNTSEKGICIKPNWEALEKDERDFFY